MGILGRLLGSDDGDSDSDNEREEKYEEETAVVTNYYDSYRATVTYPDGSSESVTYTDYQESDAVIEVSDITDTEYTIRRAMTYSRNAPKRIRLDATNATPTRFSISNIESFDVDWRDEMVDVAELDVRVRYVRESEDDEWSSRKIEIESDTDNFEVTSWRRDEWEAHRED